MTQSAAVGIDLGTTFSLAATIVNGRPAVMRDERGIALVPSCISFQPDGTVLVGNAAKERASTNPEATIFSIKRLMGRTLADLKQELELIPQQIVEREEADGRKVLQVRIGDREFTPEELSAIILREVRSRAGNPTRAVITVPAYFDDTQRQATRDAGRIAGLDVLRIVNEPTAAALAYGLDRRENGVIAVYDLGGGTFDCSILSLSDGIFKVLATNGDTFLGGDDFDRLLMQAAAQDMGIDLSQKNAALIQLLRESAERTKIALSKSTHAEFVISSIPGALPSPHYSRHFSRSEFETMIEPLIDRTLERCKSALRDANLKAAQIDEVVLVGGSTRIPYVRQRVAEFFGKPPHTDLNPDEVVAMGAAVQADILTSGRRDTLLLDVVPLSLGIETLGGVVDKLIHRNSTVPARGTTRYTTGVDNQTAILLNIYQGERELTKDCRLLGTFKLSGIPPLPAQFAQVEVTFLVNHDGILTVSAKELRSGARAEVTVQPAHGLTRDEVEHMVLESIEHAEEDFSTRRVIELRNRAELDIRHTEKALAQAGHLLTAAQRAAIRESQSQLQAAIAGTEAHMIQQAIQSYSEATNPLATLVMNEVVRQALAGTEADHLNADKL